MKTTMMDINTCRMEIIRAVIETDNIEVLHKIRRVFNRSAAIESDRVEEEMPPYTMKELDERILRSTESYHDGKYITAEDMSLKNFLK